ncbi:MAG: hypothetical protein Q9175_007866 [Cornicularia normoerica]
MNNSSRHIAQLRQRSLSNRDRISTDQLQGKQVHQQSGGSGSQLTYMNQLLRRSARDIAIANTVREDRDVIAELRARAGGVRDADVRLAKDEGYQSTGKDRERS